MELQEARDWLLGNRSSVNIVPPEPRETWEHRIAEVDAARTQEAYWSLRAYKEGLVETGDSKQQAADSPKVCKYRDAENLCTHELVRESPVEGRRCVRAGTLIICESEEFA